MNLLTVMGNFCGKNDLPRGVVDERQPCRFAPRVKFRPKRGELCVMGVWLHFLQDDREGKASKDRGVACPQEISSTPRMRRSQRPALLIQHKDIRHVPTSKEVSACAGQGSLVKVIQRFGAGGTG